MNANCRARVTAWAIIIALFAFSGCSSGLLGPNRAQTLEASGAPTAFVTGHEIPVTVAAVDSGGEVVTDYQGTLVVECATPNVLVQGEISAFDDGVASAILNLSVGDEGDLPLAVEIVFSSGRLDPARVETTLEQPILDAIVVDAPSGVDCHGPFQLSVEARTQAGTIHDAYNEGFTISCDPGSAQVYPSTGTFESGRAVLSNVSLHDAGEIAVAVTSGGVSGAAVLNVAPYESGLGVPIQRDLFDVYGISIARSGNDVYAAYADTPNGMAGTLRFEHSSDGGTTWDIPANTTLDSGVADIDILTAADTILICGDGAIYRTADRGDNWDDPVAVFPGQNPFQQNLLDVSGTCVLLALIQNDTLDGEVLSASSTDDGVTWPSGAHGSIPLNRAYSEMDAAASGSTVHLVVGDYGSSTYLDHYSSDDFGASWSEPHRVATLTDECGGLAVVADGDDVFAAYVDVGTGEIRFARSRDAGTTWLSADDRLLVTTGEVGFWAYRDLDAVMSGETILVFVEGLSLYPVYDSGAVFGHRVDLVDARVPDVVVDGSRADMIYTTGGDIYYGRSLDGGMTW